MLKKDPPFEYDLAGKRFGKIFVKQMLPGRCGVMEFCDCICDCGKSFIRRADYIINDKEPTPSCGCADENVGRPPSWRRIDYTGQKNGMLSVVSIIYDREHKTTRCLCKCDCGNYTIVTRGTFTKTDGVYPLNCGCKYSENRKDWSKKYRRDVVGERFGRLVVQEVTFGYKQKTVAKCLCDCGNTVYVRVNNLKNGTKSCGCLQSSIAKENAMVDVSGAVSSRGVKIISRHHQNKNGVWLWNCECPNCGSIFQGVPAKIMCGHTKSCGCEHRSSGEWLVASILDDLNVKYEREKTFPDCKDVGRLRFDFYVDDLNLIIEYNGAQHYHPIEVFGGDEEFDYRKRHDNIKRDYCVDNKITLVEIPYTMPDDNIKTFIKDTVENIRSACA